MSFNERKWNLPRIGWGESILMGATVMRLYVLSALTIILSCKIHKGNEHNYVTATTGQWTCYTIGAAEPVKVAAAFYAFMRTKWSISPLISHKIGETNIWRNQTRNGPSVVISFWEFSVVLLGDFEWGDSVWFTTQSNATSISFENRLSCNIYYYFLIGG